MSRVWYCAVIMAMIGCGDESRPPLLPLNPATVSFKADSDPEKTAQLIPVHGSIGRLSLVIDRSPGVRAVWVFDLMINENVLSPRIACAIGGKTDRECISLPGSRVDVKAGDTIALRTVGDFLDNNPTVQMDVHFKPEGGGDE